MAPSEMAEANCFACVQKVAGLEARQTAAEEWRRKTDAKIDKIDGKIDQLLDHKNEFEATLRVVKWVTTGVAAVVAFAVTQLEHLLKLFGKG